MAKLSDGDKIIPIKCNRNKIIVQKCDAAYQINGFYEFDIKEETFKEIFTLGHKNINSSVEMFHVGHDYIDLLKNLNTMYVDVIEYEDKVRIKFYEINLTSYDTKLVFEHLVAPGFYYKGLKYLRDGFFLFQLGNEINDDIEHTLLFLYDVKEEKLYPILEDSFRMTSSSYKIFKKGPFDYLLFDEWYIDFYEEEELISKQNELNKNNSQEIDFGYLFNNNLKVIEINNFIQQIKAGNRNIEYSIIDSANMNGWIRYCGMDDKNLYYAKKCFNESAIEILGVTKSDFQLTLIKKLNSIDIIRHICISFQNNYYITDIDNRLVIKSLNTDAVVYTYNKDGKSNYERFFNIVNDIYLIIRGEKDNVNEDSEYFKIINMANGESIYVRGVWFQNDTMVLIN